MPFLPPNQQRQSTEGKYPLFIIYCKNDSGYVTANIQKGDITWQHIAKQSMC